MTLMAVPWIYVAVGGTGRVPFEISPLPLRPALTPTYGGRLSSGRGWKLHERASEMKTSSLPLVCVYMEIGVKLRWPVKGEQTARGQRDFLAPHKSTRWGSEITPPLNWLLVNFPAAESVYYRLWLSANRAKWKRWSCVWFILILQRASSLFSFFNLFFKYGRLSRWLSSDPESFSRRCLPHSKYILIRFTGGVWRCEYECE